VSVVAVEFVRTVETAVAERAPTLALPRKREREQTAFRASRSASNRRGEPPLPLAGEGWGGGVAASEVAMEEKKPKWRVSSKLRILWSELRDHRLIGASFRRQVPIANYIADFVCHAAKLVIELDGGQHFSDQAEQADAARSAAIETQGFMVLRFSNHDVMSNRAGVLETIAAALAERAPTLALPRKRERGEEKPAGNRSS
jgi:very-short-patch-repair endonuclease